MRATAGTGPPARFSCCITASIAHADGQCRAVAGNLDAGIREGRQPDPRRRVVREAITLGRQADEGAAEIAVAVLVVVADRKSTRSELQSLMRTSYAVFCLKKNSNH